MATIKINIPTDKVDWVMDGFAIRFAYQEQIDMNPNPESKAAFTKRMIIHMIKDAANTGHNQVSLDANAVIANDVTLT